MAGGTSGTPALSTIGARVACTASPSGSGSSSSGAPAADEPRYGVEVASVDFGQRSGAIYYVPAGDSVAAGDPSVATAAVTTVVWLSDD